MNLNTTAAIVLAAGRGTRMKAKTKNKVAFSLHGKPMVAHTVDHLIEAGVAQIIAVVGFAADSVKRALGDKVDYATQHEPLGTGDALKAAIPSLDPSIKSILTVYGDDSAFYPASLFNEMVGKREATQADLLFLTIHKDDPTGLGRIVRDKNGQVIKSVEEKNATEEEKKIKEINTCFYCFSRDFLVKYIDQIQKNPISGEYYLTDMIEIALNNGKKVVDYYVEDSSIWHGVNNRSDYSRAQKKANNA